MNIRHDASRTDTEPPLHRRTPGVQGNGRGGLYPGRAGSHHLDWACATCHPVGSLFGKPQQPPLQPYPMSGAVPRSCRNYPIQSSQSVPLVVPLSSHCEDGETEAERGDATCTGSRPVWTRAGASHAALGPRAAGPGRCGWGPPAARVPGAGDSESAVGVGCSP